MKAGVQLQARKVPQRTCVGCREVLGKRALVRVVRSPEGAVELDPTGRRNGRGAYVHESAACWKKALAQGSLDRALHTAVSPDDRRALETYAAGLPAADPAESVS